MKKRNYGLIGCAVWLFLFCFSAKANEEKVETESAPKTLLTIPHVIGVQVKPLGVMYETKPHHRFMFFNPDSNILIRDAHVGLGIRMALSPSFFSYGPSITITPLTILSVTAEVSHVIMGLAKKGFGILDYSELGQDGDTTYGFRNKNGNDIGHKDFKGWAFRILPAFKIKYKRFILLYNGRFIYYRPSTYPGIFFNYLTGVVTSHNSWTFIHDTIFLYEFTSLKTHKHALRIGINSNFVNVFPDNKTELKKAYQWKIGPMMAWTLRKQIFNGAVQNPTLLLMIHYYAKDIIADKDIKRTLGGALGISFNTDWRKSI